MEGNGQPGGNSTEPQVELLPKHESYSLSMGNASESNDAIGVTLEENRAEYGNREPFFHQSSPESLDNASLDLESAEPGDWEVKEAALNLLTNAEEMKRVVLQFENDKYYLFPTSTDNEYPVIFTDIKFNVITCNHFMTKIRQFLESIYGVLRFSNAEVTIELPQLNLTIYEDNVYNEKLSFQDIQSIFKVLKERSIANNETDVPDHLFGEIKLKDRFVTRFNSLVELAESSATLKNIQPFSNDISHPVLLDDVAPIQEEVIIMDSEDDDEKSIEPERIINQNGKRPTDEPLEIVLDTEDDV